MAAGRHRGERESDARRTEDARREPDACVRANDCVVAAISVSSFNTSGRNQAVHRSGGKSVLSQQRPSRLPEHIAGRDAASPRAGAAATRRRTRSRVGSRRVRSEEAADDAPLSGRASRGARERGDARRRPGPRVGDGGALRATPGVSGARARATARASAGSPPRDRPRPDVVRRGRAVVDWTTTTPETRMLAPREKGPAGASGAGVPVALAGPTSPPAAASSKPPSCAAARPPPPPKATTTAPSSGAGAARPSPSGSAARRPESPTRSSPPPSSSRRGVAPGSTPGAPTRAIGSTARCRYRPTFYDRRTKHRFVNAGVCRREELTDSFIADDEDDDGDEDSSDERGRPEEPRPERPAAERRASSGSSARSARSSARTRTRTRSAAAAFGRRRRRAGEKSSAGEKSRLRARPRGRRVVRRRRRSLRGRSPPTRFEQARVLIDDEPDARPAPAPPRAPRPRPGVGPGGLVPVLVPRGVAVVRRPPGGDVDPEPQLTPGSPRERGVGKRRRDTETWNRKLEALREGMRGGRRRDDSATARVRRRRRFFFRGFPPPDRAPPTCTISSSSTRTTSPSRELAGLVPESDRYDSISSPTSPRRRTRAARRAEDGGCCAVRRDGRTTARRGAVRTRGAGVAARDVRGRGRGGGAPSRAFFCARCDANGARTRRSRRGSLPDGGAGRRTQKTGRRRKQTTRARAPDPEGRTRNPHDRQREKIIAALRADDPGRSTEPPRGVLAERAPARSKDARGAGEFGAREVAAASWEPRRPGPGPPPPPGRAKSVASCAGGPRGPARETRRARRWRALPPALAAATWASRSVRERWGLGSRRGGGGTRGPRAAPRSRTRVR